VPALTQKASLAQAAWSLELPEKRARVIHTVARLIEARWDDIAAWIMRETGAVRAKADFEIATAVALVEDAARMLRDPQTTAVRAAGTLFSYTERVPLGTVGVISPFNFPLILSIRAVAPALATGNSVVLKPDPQTPITGGLLLADLLTEAGIPAGLFCVIPGGADVGESLCLDNRINMIAFTGSTAAGRRVGELAGRTLKKVSLELGGKNALVVLDDADLELAVAAASFGAFLHQGQICMASGRILVQDTIAEQFVDKLVQHAKRLPAGDPMSGTVALGPLINQGQHDRVRNLVEETVKSGAKLRTGGPAKGVFFEATVLENVTPGMMTFDHEIFGPVASVTRFSTDAEAIDLANRGELGLSAGVISRSIERALRLGRSLRAGMLHINDQTVLQEAHIPFGGMGASGNGGRIGGPANWEEFTQWRWVTVKSAPPPYPF
jgi:benzaldehyde dehydrogenase (NAD)